MDSSDKSFIRTTAVYLLTAVASAFFILFASRVFIKLGFPEYTEAGASFANLVICIVLLIFDKKDKVDAFSGEHKIPVRWAFMALAALAINIGECSFRINNVQPLSHNLFLLLAVLLEAFEEELFFRAYAVNSYEKGYKLDKKSHIAMMCVFAIFHVILTEGSWQSIFYSTVYALAFESIVMSFYLESRNVLKTTVIHFMFFGASRLLEFNSADTIPVIGTAARLVLFVIAVVWMFTVGHITEIEGEEIISGKRKRVRN